MQVLRGSGTSGNIVDIMNAAITANPEVTGDKLARLFRAYIDVCYQKEDGTAYYATRSDLFNGYDACWDADDLAALLRVAKTNQVNLTGNKGYPRRGHRSPFGTERQNSRYGTPCKPALRRKRRRFRYEYTYIDKDGKLQDAPTAKNSFCGVRTPQQLLKQEGLVDDYSGGKDFGYTAGPQYQSKGRSNDDVRLFADSDAQRLCSGRFSGYR